MATPHDAPGASLLTSWQRLQRLPLGRWLFMRLVRWTVPYTGALGSQVQELRPGYARITLRDRRGVRNHLRSVHAVALVNLGEFASGLAMLTGLGANVRGIVTNLRARYEKKARGTLVAECHASIPDVTDHAEHEVEAVIRDGANDVVARVTATWNLRRAAP